MMRWEPVYWGLVPQDSVYIDLSTYQTGKNGGGEEMEVNLTQNIHTINLGLWKTNKAKFSSSRRYIRATMSQPNEQNVEYIVEV